MWETREVRKNVGTKRVQVVGTKRDRERYDPRGTRKR